jgi:hypothetical protein
MQLTTFIAKDPCTLPPHRVPATSAQHVPLFGYAGHTPNSWALAPPSSLPHFLNSQQFISHPAFQVHSPDRSRSIFQATEIPLVGAFFPARFMRAVSDLETLAIGIVVIGAPEEIAKHATKRLQRKRALDLISA